MPARFCNDLGDTRTEATCLHAYASAHDIIEQPPGHKQAQVPQVVFKVRELRAEGGSSVQPVNFVMLRS